MVNLRRKIPSDPKSFKACIFLSTEGVQTNDNRIDIYMVAVKIILHACIETLTY